MATVATNPKQEAHELIERISVAQASAVVTLITSMLDPVDRAIANAPFEDEEISDEENRAVAASKAWLKDHEPISNEEVLAEFGLTQRISNAWDARLSNPNRVTLDSEHGQEERCLDDQAKADLRAIDQPTACAFSTPWPISSLPAKAT